ncbi:MAG: metallophosphoesterase [Anaerolineae bacterium]
MKGSPRRHTAHLDPGKTPNMTLLERRWLYNFMVFIQEAAAWPVWLMAGVLLVIAVAVFALGSLGGSSGSSPAPAAAAVVAVVLFLFSLGDWALLAWLPRDRRGFGPVAPQLFILLIPRVLAALIAVLIAGWLGPATGLGLLGLAQIAGTVIYVWGLAVEPLNLSLTTLAVETDRWPESAPPLRLLHISDIHLEREGRREARLLDLVARAAPDLILLTGDYLSLSFTREAEAVRQVRALLGRLQAPLGVYATLGSPPVDVRDVAPYHFEGDHIHLLRRDAVELDLGDGRRLALLGLDCTHDLAYDGEALRRVEALAPAGVPRLLLYHSPELMPLAQELDVTLYLCGHTHGGQVRLPGYGAIFTSSATGKRYEMGRYEENGTTQYVSRGVGLEGLSAPRLRLFCPPEITLVTLQGTGADPAG